MKCSVCANEIPDGGRFCGVCGQSVAGETEFESVRGHWNAVAKDTEQYETKRKEEAARIRKHSRRIRVRWVLMALVVIGLVGFLTMTDPGKNLANNTVLYANGWWAVQNRDYHLADEYLDTLGNGFLNTRNLKAQCQEAFRQERYEEASALFGAGDFEGALNIYREMGDYRNSVDWAESCLNIIRERLDTPVVEWTFAENLTGSDGSTWSGGAEWKKVVDSQIIHGAYFDGSDQMKLKGSLTITENWSLSILVASLTEENAQILSVCSKNDDQFSYQLYTRDGHIVWEFHPHSGVAKLESELVIQPGKRWYFITLSKEGKTLSLYVDGVLQGSAISGDPTTEDREVELYLGNWDRDTELTAENVPFQGFVGYLAIYNSTITPAQAELVYEPLAYNATHRWDTSYYFLPEDQEHQDHFIFFHDEYYGNQLCLAMVSMEYEIEDLSLFWFKEAGQVTFGYQDAPVNCVDYYYLEGESWIYIGTEDGFSGLYGVTSVTSSDLPIYDENGEEIPPVILGGR